MEVDFYILNSFSENFSGGNPAAIVLSLDFSEDDMKKIASYIGFSETAFLEKIDEKTYKIRYFSPTDEVDLCGHATIAAFSLLKQKNLILNGNYKLITKADTVDIFISDIVTMSQKLPIFYETIDFDEISSCFKNLKRDDLACNLPIQVVSTGLKDIIVPVKSLDCLLNLKLDFNQVSLMSKKHSTIGMHIFSLETLDKNNTAHARNFAPLYGINEESATGTANGALSCYLFKYLKNDFDFTNLTFEQGNVMDLPSKIYSCLDIENDEIKAVKVGGRADFIKKSHLNI